VLPAESRRRADLILAAAMVLAVALAVTLVVATSAAVHTESDTAGDPVPPVPTAPPHVPATLAEVWQAPSSATPAPVAVGPVVVTGNDTSVTGRDPLTGRVRWSYRRDLPLCTVGSAWSRAVAVYRNGAYCSEVTSLDAATGARGATRNSDVAVGTQLIFDGYLVTATGASLLETWRSDLVKTMEYGRLRSPVQPATQPRPDCVHTSVAVVQGRLGVVERCPGEAHDRLTVLLPAGAEEDRPDEDVSTVLPASGTRLVALSEGDTEREALLLNGPPRLSVRGVDGEEVADYPLDLPPGDLAGDPPGEVVPTTRIPGAVLWWTGSRTIALDADDLRPLWTVPGALGPGTLMAGAPVVPVPGAVLELNPIDGRVLRTVPVDRHGYQGPVGLAALGPVLLEQRGSTVVALR
jgi:hypothetical protein